MLASLGGRAARHASALLPHPPGGPPGASRGLHIPSYVRVHPRLPTSGTAQRLFTQSRNLLNQFFHHLTTPGFRLPDVASNARSLHHAARPSIQQSFSLPARVALSRPLRPQFLPRPPTVSRSVAQVGLSTARNFSTGRPIFQNLVENVPVAGRAFYEADWEIKMRKEREMMKPKKSQSHVIQARKEMTKPNRQPIAKENITTSEAAVMEAQLDEYFPAPVVADVTTCLLIPLAPTPTARTPLSENNRSRLSLLPLQDLASMHVSHEMHSLRVSSLFSRLDVANVWARGVQCSAFSHGGADGVCTMLKVEFVGWTKAEVRGVIGESGSGWCVLEEHHGSGVPRSYLSDEDDDALSDTSSLFSYTCDEFPTDGVDPADSLYLPALDFSLSFQPPSTSTLASLYQPDSEFDPWSDSEVSSESGISDTDGWARL